MIYGPKDWAVLWFVAGLLTGVVIGFSSCAPPEQPQHVTTGGRT